MGKLKKVKIYAFWKGTVMCELTFNSREYLSIKTLLKKDYFAGYESDIYSYMEGLDRMERTFYEESKKNGHYEIIKEDMLHLMFAINSIVKKGLRPNNNDFGVLLIKELLK